MEQSENPCDANGRAVVFFTLSGMLIILIAVASWVPDSRMTKLWWVPERAGRLADWHPNLRTAVPFVPLAFLLYRGFEGRSFKRPLLGTLAVGGACLGLSEFGQFFLPQRTADGKDLMWGGLGIALGVGIALLSLRWLRKKVAGD